MRYESERDPYALEIKADRTSLHSPPEIKADRTRLHSPLEIKEDRTRLHSPLEIIKTNCYALITDGEAEIAIVKGVTDIPERTDEGLQDRG